MAQQPVKLLRTARIWHKNVAAALFIFFFIISITGFLLGWKNLFAGKIYSANAGQAMAKPLAMKDWLPLDSLKNIATAAFKARIPNEKFVKPDNLNASMGRGFIRFSFGRQYNVQLNAQTGELQSIDKKAPDWILKLHDGEMLDDLLGSKNGLSKRIYVSIMGLALLFMTVSGFWLWFKPMRMKRAKQNNIE